jgi:hypothetical protein
MITASTLSANALTCLLEVNDLRLAAAATPDNVYQAFGLRIGLSWPLQPRDK